MSDFNWTVFHGRIALWLLDFMLKNYLLLFQPVVDIAVFDGRYLKVEVDEQDAQSKENAVAEMYVIMLERFNIALHKASI